MISLQCLPGLNIVVECSALSSRVPPQIEYLLSEAELDAAGVLGKKWVLEIVMVLDKGPIRYQDLADSIPISEGSLSKRLIELREAGVIVRDCLNPQDRRKLYLYSLHPDGAPALRKVCRAVRAYSNVDRRDVDSVGDKE